MRAKQISAALAVCISLAACGDTQTEQALYGGGAGLLGALVVDGNPVAGAAVGAAANLLYCETQNTCN
ncbi:hypothetical protein DS909_08175 [Phaeobacter gallaeciensis]|uniref:Lipoprotein n=2 Tax=Roseobacteraceae TaxID=2854170 RepID=A0A366X033_9RHOB|nr:hypothetical protein [Phaeobacter gallaeciensis]MBT3139444.1 hypothetical protein [Falsiruegeria litorea]MBT8166988.1 hypothetical protein [Falsiruegeria litorea]RBW57376.1 hypothetical protein DS909_08175 [Phaeobacter gallaeciensis]